MMAFQSIDDTNTFLSQATAEAGETAPRPADGAWMNDFGQWLRDNVKPGKTIEESSIAAYGFDIGVYARWYKQINGEEFHPRSCNRVDFRSFQKFCEDKRVKPATWNRRKVALTKLSAWAKDMGWIKEDAARDLAKMDMALLAPKWLSDKDHRKFVRQLEADINNASTPNQEYLAIRDRAICMLMLVAGLRESEVVNLRWYDLTMGERSGEVYVYDSKRKLTGTVPLAARLRNTLRAWQLKSAVLAEDDEYVFKSVEKNMHISRRCVQRTVDLIAKEAGIEGITPHTLRHTCCHLAERKYGLVVANRLMRHKSLSTTMRYATPSMDELQTAVDSIEI